MEITITTKRECCEQEDLKPYKGVATIMKGAGGPTAELLFCLHCGQLWLVEPVTDAAGGRDTQRLKVHPIVDSSNTIQARYD